MSHDLVIHTTDATYQEDVLQSELPVLLDFWSPTCGPCIMLSPVLDEIAVEYAGRARIAKLNTHENPHTAAIHHLRGVPTLIMFVDGQPKATQLGLRPGNLHQQIRDLINPHLKTA